MMRQLFVIFSLSITAVICAQQHSNDSLTYAVRTPFYSKLFTRNSIIPNRLLTTPIKNFTASSLYFSSENGDLKYGQEPKNITLIGANTQGIFKNKKHLFHGKITVEKEYFTDLAYNLANNKVDRGIIENPHYYMVSKSGDWNNQNYKLNGGWAYQISPKFNLSINALYNLKKAFRYNRDPRPEITFNRLVFKTILGYDINVKNHIYFGGSLGYDHKDTEVKFSNGDVNVPANYEIYVKRSLGFGNINYPGSRNEILKNSISQIVLGHDYTDHNLTINSTFRYQQQKNSTYSIETIDALKEHILIAIHNQDQFVGSLNFIKKLSPNKNTQLYLEADILKNTNFLQAKQGKNYEANQLKLLADFSLIKHQNQHINYDYGVQTIFRAYDQKDALSFTSTKLSHLDLATYFSKDYTLKEKRIFTPLFTLGGQMSLSNNYINGNAAYLSNINSQDYAGLSLVDFYRDVIAHDVELNKNNLLFAELNLKLRFANHTKFNSTIQTLFKYKTDTSFNRSRWWVGASITLDY